MAKKSLLMCLKGLRPGPSAPILTVSLIATPLRKHRIGTHLFVKISRPEDSEVTIAVFESSSHPATCSTKFNT